MTRWWACNEDRMRGLLGDSAADVVMVVGVVIVQNDVEPDLIEKFTPPPWEI